MCSAIKTNHELEYGNTGLIRMEETGYFWKKEEKTDMTKIFRLMGIDKIVENYGKTSIKNEKVKHLVAKGAY